jgi:hypothetical protein
MTEVKITSNLKLYPWQLQVTNELKTHWRGYTHVVKSKRQVGKSIMLESILLQTAINKSKSCSICLSPTLEQARKVFNDVKKVVKPTKLYSKHNDLQLLIMLRNGSTIFFKSAEQKDGLRGYTVTGIYVVDEAAFISDEVFFETLAWVNVSQAPVVLCSTPKHKTGFFFKYYMLGLSNEPNIFSYNWSEFDTSALLPAEKLAEYQRNMPESQFKTEFLGEFLDNEGGVFGDFGKIISNEYNPNLNCYMGIDWGTGQGQDETAIAIFNSDRQMIGLYHFSDKDETATVNYIIELMKQYKPLKCQVETNSIGSVFYGLLDKAIKSAGLPVMLLRFTTTNESKERLINNFQVAMQNDDVTILDNQTLRIQMDMYEMKVNQNGKRTYNAASGYHDDCIIAMLLAFNCISTGHYCIR